MTVVDCRPDGSGYIRHHCYHRERTRQFALSVGNARRRELVDFIGKKAARNPNVLAR
jgi:hypothetical protein